MLFLFIFFYLLIFSPSIDSKHTIVLCGTYDSMFVSSLHSKWIFLLCKSTKIRQYIYVRRKIKDTKKVTEENLCFFLYYKRKQINNLEPLFNIHSMAHNNIFYSQIPFFNVFYKRTLTYREIFFSFFLFCLCMLYFSSSPLTQ